MTKTQIKQEFHNLIENIDNDALLFGFYELLKNRSQRKNGELWEKLSPDEQSGLIKLSNQIENENASLIPNEEIRKKHQEWL